MELRTIALLITPERLHHALVAIESARKFDPSINVNIAYFGSSLPSESQRALFGTNTYWYLKGEPVHFRELFKERPRFILELFEEGYDRVLHIGADILFLDYFEHYFIGDENWICPHLVHLPINANKAISIHKTGLLNSDLSMWNNSSSTNSFLNWQYEMLKQRNDNKDGFFFDQVYLDHGVMDGIIDVNRSYYDNISYYNLEERLLHIKQATTFQFSGFVEQIPSMLTRYKVDKKLLTLEVVQLALKYGELLNEAKIKVESV